MTPPQTFSLAVVGQSLIKRDVRADDHPAFRAVCDTVRAADLAFTNFEGTVLGRHGGWPMKGKFFGGVAPEMLAVLRDLGFGAVSLANNHGFDLGPAGVLSTIEAAAACGLVHAGTGADLVSATAAGVGRGVALVAMDAGPAGDHCYAQDADAHVGARPGLNRLRVIPRITVPPAAFATLRDIETALGLRASRATYRPGEPAPKDTPDRLDIDGLTFQAGTAIARRGVVDADDAARNLGAIRAAADAGNRVIAYVHHHHWEARWEEIPGWARAFARDCIDAGAALYVSHGVPLLQGIELHRGRPILHGLGNFIFHSRHGATSWALDEVWQSVVATIRFDGASVTRIELAPIVLGGEAALVARDFSAREVPHLAGAVPGRTILDRLAARSAPLGTRIDMIDGIGVIEP